ncbi:MAG: histidine phosphatase family protein [Acidimicrobiales bacterium]|nr:histidine phosphatase family protein [Acidimicrobiales bacterium]
MTTDEPRAHPQRFPAAPPGSARIVLVRHGQSIPFVEGTPFPLVAGHGDPPLSPRGEWQAERVGERLAQEPISAIYASSLQRTSQTATPLASRRGLDIHVEHDLREVFLGDFEGGLFRQKAAEGHPAVHEMYRTGDWGAIPNGETNEQLRARTVGALEGIVARHVDEMVAVFCHGGVIAALLGHAVSVPLATFAGSRNGSLAYLYCEPGSGHAERNERSTGRDEGEPGSGHWRIRGYNDASHIGPLTADLEPH